MSVNPKKIIWPVVCLVLASVLGFLFIINRNRVSAFPNAKAITPPPVAPTSDSASKVASDAVPNTPKTESATSSLGEAAAIESTAPNSQDDKAVWLTIRPKGFETKDLTLKAGDYFVVMQNATGVDDSAFRIQRESGERLHLAHFSRFTKHWRQTVRFKPGVYRVSEATHPKWTCRITVN